MLNEDPLAPPAAVLVPPRPPTTSGCAKTPGSGPSDHPARNRHISPGSALAVSIQINGKLSLTPALSPRRGRTSSSAGLRPPFSECPKRDNKAFPLLGADLESDCMLTAWYSVGHFPRVVVEGTEII